MAEVALDSFRVDGGAEGEKGDRCEGVRKLHGCRVGLSSQVPPPPRLLLLALVHADTRHATPTVFAGTVASSFPVTPLFPPPQAVLVLEPLSSFCREVMMYLISSLMMDAGEFWFWE